MNFLELSDKDRAAYTNFLAAQGGSFLQSWDWGEWQRSLGREPVRLSLSEPGGGWLAVVQLIQLPLPFGRHYWYAPYGPTFAAGTAGIRPAFSQIASLLGRRYAKAAFIRLEPACPDLRGCGFPGLVKSRNIQPAATLAVDLAGVPQDLLNKMHAKTRYNIRLSFRHGVTVNSELAVVPQKGLYFQEVVELILATQKRQHYRGHDNAYYRRLIDFFSLSAAHGAAKLTVYKALLKRQLLACGIMMDFGPTRTYLFGGSSDEHRHVMAPYAMHYQAMLDAQAAKLLHYDLGGSENADGSQQGFSRFKQGFGGRILRFAGAYDTVLSPVFYRFYWVGRQGVRVWRHLPFLAD